MSSCALYIVSIMCKFACVFCIRDGFVGDVSSIRYAESVSIRNVCRCAVCEQRSSRNCLVLCSLIFCSIW